MRLIRLVTFDALHTIITPRYPIHVQYSQVFSPYVGELPPAKIRESFQVALKTLQKENPSYNSGAETWWREVIRRTAIGAGASKEALDPHLDEIVRKLMKRFSSGEGYKAFDDAILTVRRIHDELGIKTAVVSNGDSRIRNVLDDLGFPQSLNPIVLSEEMGVEKPSQEIFARTLEILNQTVEADQDMIQPGQCLHIGDELICDYNGASEVGWHALLLRRPGSEGEQEHKQPGENIEQVKTILSPDDLRFGCHFGTAGGHGKSRRTSRKPPRLQVLRQ